RPAVLPPTGAAARRGHPPPHEEPARMRSPHRRTAAVAACFLLGLAVAAVRRLPADAPNPGKADPTGIRSARSGPWSAPATWEGGKVPAAGARVLVRAGHRVVYDVRSAETIRGINVAGTLSFAPDRDTLLVVGLIKVQAGEEYS